MKHERLITQRFTRGENKPTQPPDKKHWPIKILLILGIVAVGILTACHTHGYGYYGGPVYSPGGFIVGGFHHGYHFGGHHSFGHGGFGHGGGHGH